MVRCAADYQPQQSVLNPQAGQRQTACILNISAPQRSQTTADSAGGVVRLGGVDGDRADSAIMLSSIDDRRRRGLSRPARGIMITGGTIEWMNARRSS